MTVTLEEAQARLPDLISRLRPGEEVIITDEGQPVARLHAEEKPKRRARKPGSAKGILTIVQEDEEHLKDFQTSVG